MLELLFLCFKTTIEQKKRGRYACILTLELFVFFPPRPFVLDRGGTQRPIIIENRGLYKIPVFQAGPAQPPGPLGGHHVAGGQPGPSPGQGSAKRSKAGPCSNTRQWPHFRGQWDDSGCQAIPEISGGGGIGGWGISGLSMYPQPLEFFLFRSKAPGETPDQLLTRDKSRDHGKLS